MHTTRKRRDSAPSTAGGELGSDELYELAYGELRRIARAKLRSGRPQTLHTTALVNEAFVKLSAQDRGFVDKQHFLAVAARAMRQILVDHYRAAGAKKRGSGAAVTPLDEVEVADESVGETILAVHEALETLERHDQRLARVVEFKFFGGLTEPEIGEVLGVTSRTVSNDWRLARAWLSSELEVQA